MQYTHVQRVFKNPIFVYFRKQYCPQCGNRLKRVKVSKIVNSNSEESINFNFHTMDNYMIGNVKFIWSEFRCQFCNKNYTIEELKKIVRKGRNK